MSSALDPPSPPPSLKLVPSNRIRCFLRYGLPDPDCRREHDARFRLRMTSVCYVHTQRFVQELLAFALNFIQLQDVFGRGRAALAGRKVQ